MPLGPRDNRLIDAIEGRDGVRVDEIVWRIVREGRDPTNCSASGGRWDDRSFDVLYTSRTRDGVVGEMFFHLRQGQPVVPSRVRFHLHELKVRLGNALDLSTMASLTELGLDASTYGRLSYAERQAEYPRTQEIAEVGHFLGYDGLVVPSARSGALNIVVFCDRIASDRVEAIEDYGPVDWKRISP